MKSGRTITRQYALANEDLARVLEVLLSDRAYRRALFPIFQADPHKILRLSVLGAYGQPADQGVSLTRAQQEALIEAYKRDLLEAGTEVFLEGSAIGEFQLVFPESYVWPESASTVSDLARSQDTAEGEAFVTVGQFYLYPAFTHTLSLLENYGIQVEGLSPEKVEEVTLYLSSKTQQETACQTLLNSLTQATLSQEEGTDGEGQLLVTSQDPQDIQRMVDFTGGNRINLLESGYGGENYIDISFQDDTVFGYSF